MEQDAVANNLPAVIAGHELLGLVDAESVEAVDRQMREQLACARTLDEQIHHVVRLIEQHRGLAPGALLVAPLENSGATTGYT
jgi:hypothetical protein